MMPHCHEPALFRDQRKIVLTQRWLIGSIALVNAAHDGLRGVDGMEALCANVAALSDAAVNLRRLLSMTWMGVKRERVQHAQETHKRATVECPHRQEGIGRDVSEEGSVGSDSSNGRTIVGIAG